MTEKVIVQKSLVEQIFDEMFKKIEGTDEFDAETIEEIKGLAKSGNLGETVQIKDVIKSASGGIQ
ncbi:MAG: hypothetical protein K8T10_00300 [Candidatus Eremiobacteraeota bacterium]|nr:hypothetical protein [Candidatus Eremiobacteraeota bacterium]